ncbi:carboxypeptidase Y [Podospora appendiculata]|uniref:Carboxypeptidase Y n=1 Tax=Podospora appendiculata TaxID=314037 RepID=A0AAE1CBR0_9PEZI|nr:carboxypeptidase Y [Podospora appendiculata]
MRLPLLLGAALGCVGTALARPGESGFESPQQPLLADDANQQTKHSAPYSVKEHSGDADICAAGSKHYTGTVSVSDEKKLFFWFLESRNDPADSPVVVWLNGGPGGSSMFGLFREIGPCLTNEHNNGTDYNEHSWTEFANVLFIDQPAGVGFSTVRNGSTGGPDNALEAGEDFNLFLTVFFRDIFPEFSSNGLHIAGESFGGKYVPSYVRHISERQKQGANPLVVPIQSIILVDAVIDMVSSGALGHYDHFCSVDEKGARLKKNGFNETACSAMEEDTPEAERLMALCRETYDRHVCKTANFFADEHLGKWLAGDVYEGGRDPYDDRRKCGNNPPICEPFDSAGYASYLNLPHVKETLGFDKDFRFNGINNDTNTRWEASGEIFIPSTREVTYILDKTPTRVLVINGNNDIIVNTEGQKRVYDHLPWRRQAAFRMRKFQDWAWPDKSGTLTTGGQFKTAGDSGAASKLSFVSVDEAGHASPGDQREAIAWLVGCWTGSARSDGLCFV